MTLLSGKSLADRPEFIFVGDHPAIDFANTLSMSQGKWFDHLRVWADVVEWLTVAGLSTDSGLQISASWSAEAVDKVVELRQGWKAGLERLPSRVAKLAMTSSRS